MEHRLHCTLLAALAMGAGLAQADTGKLLLTGGVSSIGGAAGGGLTPWAVIGTNATEGEAGFSGYATRAATHDYGLTGYGVAVGLQDRVEFSLARQDFDASPALALNGIAPFGVTPGQHIKMDVVGIKLRVAGFRARQGLRPEIDADAVGRLERREQVAGAAAELEHPLARRNQEAHELDIVLVIGSVELAPAFLLVERGLDLGHQLPLSRVCDLRGCGRLQRRHELPRTTESACRPQGGGRAGAGAF